MNHIEIKKRILSYYKKCSSQNFHASILRYVYHVNDYMHMLAAKSINKPDVINLMRPQLLNVGDLAISKGIHDGLKRMGGFQVVSLSVDFIRNYKTFQDSNVIVGGGSIITPRVLKLISLYLSGNVSLFGVEIFGEPSGLTTLKDIKKFDYVGVRSDRSKVKAESYGFDDPLVIPDAAWLIDTERLRQNHFNHLHGYRILGINLTPWPKPDHWRCLVEPENLVDSSYIGVLCNYLAWLQAIIASAIRSGWKVVFIPFELDDFYFAKAIFGREFSGHLIFPGYSINPLRNLALIMNLDLLIATRYHAHVFSLMTGTQLLSVPYSDKVVELTKTLELPEGMAYPNSSFGHGFVLSETKRIDIRRSAEVALANAIAKMNL